MIDHGIGQRKLAAQ
jgi:hypothetical protein